MDRFFDEQLLETEYLQFLKEEYEDHRGTPFLNVFRCYPRFVEAISAIHAYRSEHAKSFAKRIKHQQLDHKSCEAIFTELIVYSYYLPLVSEGLIRSLDIKHDDYDLRVDCQDGKAIYFEVFCIMPDFPKAQEGRVVSYDVKTHTQTAFSSVRQKLLRKIEKQKQLCKDRDNYAVIELNNSTIAGDFAVLSSLSGGYKVTIDTNTMEKISEGYDWSESIFHDPATENLKGIIYFSLGDYSQRRVMVNPNYCDSKKTGN